MKQDEVSQSSDSKQGSAAMDSGESGNSTAVGVPYKVVVVAPTCFYYQAELFRTLAAHPRIDLEVLFCSREGLDSTDIPVMYKSDAKWGIKEELLLGYRYIFMRNYSPLHSYLKPIFGLINIGIWNQLRKERPDLVVLMSWMNPTWWIAVVACLCFRVPFVYLTDANVQAELRRPKWKRWLKGVMLGKVLFPLTAGFLCAGTANKELYRLYGVKDAKLFPFAYSWGYQKLIEARGRYHPDRQRIRAELGIPPDSFVLLFCGRLSKVKRIFDLMAAYERLDVPQKALIFVGNGTLEQPLMDYVNLYNLKSVYFFGFQTQTELPKYYAVSDVLILPSSRETWGIVVSEALCFGLPVIVSDQVGSASDLVRHGSNGFIFPVGDRDALFQRLEQLAGLPEEKRAAMGTRSMDLITKWSQRDLAGFLEQCLDDIHSRRARGLGINPG